MIALVLLIFIISGSSSNSSMFQNWNLTLSIEYTQDI